MPTLGSDNFSQGWIPSEDAVRGRANGLVRMDNLNLDEKSAVRLTKGTLKASPEFGNAPISVYSQNFDNVKHRYVGLDSGEIVKDVGEAGTFGTTVLTGGIIDTAYGSAFGQVLICSGNKRKKDDGTYIRNLGIPTPETPSVVINEKYSLDVIPDASAYTVAEGTEQASSTQAKTIQADLDTFRVVGEVSGALDLTAIQSGVTDTASEGDQFTLWIKPNNSTKTKLVRIEFLLEVPSGTDEHISNYYYYEWDFTRDLNLLNKGIDQDIGLSFDRAEATKVGFDASLDWASVRIIRVIVENAAVQEVKLQNLVIEGGRGSLTGTYRYLQVNAFDNGRYEAKSVASIETGDLELDHQYVKITPDAPTGFGTVGHEDETNKIYIYRSNRTIGTAYTLIAIREDLSEFIDNISDIEASEGIEGSTIVNRTANLFLQAIPDFVIDLAASYFRRTIYITEGKIRISDLDNPDAVDSRFILDTSGDESEINLWSVKVTDSQLLVGTTKDIYSISGTLQMLPDGTPDVTIRSLGADPPPISDARAVYNGTVIYMSKAGWQVLSGASNQSLIGETRLLYEGETRYDIQPVLIGGNNQVNYDCVVSKNKLFTTVTLADGVNRRMYVYDLVDRYWYPYFLNPVALFSEEDDTIVATFTAASDYYLRVINTGDVLDADPTLGGNLQSFYLQTCYLDGAQPNNRKDTKVLKVYADSDNQPVTVSISYDGNLDTFTSLGIFQFDGPTIHNISLSTTAAQLGKSFAIRLEGAAKSFYFYYWTVEFDARPEQVNYLRVPPTNFGAGGRKRFYDLPFSLDALGNNFTVTPYLDGNSVAANTETFGGSNTKDFYTLAMREETIGHELGIDIQVEGNGVIEFYELINPKHTEVLPDLSRWFRIPYTNLGTPSRKRFVRIALVIDTRGRSVSFTPLVDSIELPPLVFSTNRKETVIYYITSEVVGTDLGGIIDGGETPFEFYGWDSDETVTETLPGPAKHIYACTDFGTAARKRFSRNSFVCNPRGGSISFEPILDGVRQGPKTFSGARKQTFSYYYLEDKVFVDLCYEVKALTDEPFEFYEILRPERLEVLPEPVKFFRIPRTNLGTDARKRFFAFAFFINTRGHDVRFTPYIDGVARSETSVFNTNTESTAIHYFTSEVIGHDIGGNLETVAGEAALAFEFYGVNQDETVSEKAPGPAKYLVIPPENLGIAARKRVRTIPISINTRGGAVQFTPTIDGVSFPPSSHSTTEKRTVLHYFETDAFGIDVGGILETTDGTPFEFYGLGGGTGPGGLEHVQLLPVAKKFDQVGPLEFPRRGFIRRIRIRMVATGSSLEVRIFDKDTNVFTEAYPTIPNIEKDYDFGIPKTVQGSIFRIELQSSDAFHRYYIDVWHNLSGGQTELQQTRMQ